MTIPKPDLKSLMVFIGERLPVTQEQYPKADLSPEGQRHHAVSHGAHHLMKSVGRIAAQAEAGDHGRTMDMLAIRKATISMLVSTLNLANELAMGPEEIAFEVARSFNET